MYHARPATTIVTIARLASCFFEDDAMLNCDGVDVGFASLNFFSCVAAGVGEGAI